MTFLECTFKPFKRHILRVISGSNNPIILCLSWAKCLGCIYKGQKVFLNAIHLSEEIKHPWSSLGAKDSTGDLQDNSTSRLTVPLVTSLRTSQAWRLEAPFPLWSHGMQNHSAPPASPRTESTHPKNLQTQGEASFGFLVGLLPGGATAQKKPREVCSEDFWFHLCHSRRHASCQPLQEGQYCAKGVLPDPLSF